ncbi:MULTISPECIES: LuxR C-terminal-related transcriptional regulator [unclassified Rahnella]|uniref:LuxR C-terminal-related transcriptional regulator n=1 Tax=Rahnella TaxID=34037 RepID=UPI0006F4FB27|nr:LuxR C-terminal-related transcriptional regulator [Rahnella sp. Larv3_ips]KQN56396.1 LuxR family transcriptional regulator [Serratia sp. Leaf51]MBB6113453.1 DNA-binding NarL/FixJ family response regulator [Rahnella inusitata]THD50123.1 helix-turn-helix domain-containing protein [Enterobacteriaceae bacterium ML5]
MKLSVIEPCGFTRLGVFSYLIENNDLDIIDSVNISQALKSFNEFQPDLILVNMTQYCHSAELSEELKAFFEFRHGARIYCYIDANYPECDDPIPITRDVFILNKQSLTTLLKQIASDPDAYVQGNNVGLPRMLFSDQEILVMNYWMSEMPNYRIARKLNISSRTVYVHKRHLAQKIKVRNRLEFCFIYNLIKYLFWPIDDISASPISRQIKDDLLMIYKAHS